MTNNQKIDFGMLESIIECTTDQVFEESSYWYDLEFGDISPCQMERLEKIRQDLKELVIEYINQNNHDNRI